jgi:hypothetical protein
MIPKAEVLSAIVKVSEAVGKDLWPLFQDHLPSLNTDPLPPADAEMADARENAIERVSGR